MAKSLILILHPFLPDGVLSGWATEFSDCEFVDGRPPPALERHLKDMVMAYGVPPLDRIKDAPSLRWIQLLSAGVPAELCPQAQARGITVTNLAGLYGATIAEHALALMLIISRNFQTALRNQQERRWDRTVADTMTDLHGKTLAVVGLGNIGQNIARLAQACGMRIVGCPRTSRHA